MSLINDIFYNGILKPILSLSTLGRTSMSGKADSGMNFEHMYRNKASGKTPFGIVIDRILLSLPSVRATRERKNTMVKILKNEILNNNVSGKKTRIIDLASGPARYIVELLDSVEHSCVEAFCLDSDQESIEYGTALAGDKPVRYVKADITRLEKLKKFGNNIGWRPNVIVVSGLFEYEEDFEVTAKLKSIYDSLSEDGLFLCVSLADNPSRKLIEKLGKTSQGRWALFYRHPDIFRRWLVNAGFKSVVVSLDKWGMYEFCTGRK